MALIPQALGYEGFQTDEMLLDGKARHLKHSKPHDSSKASQQRYRERKKAKFSEMEETIAELQQQVQRLQELQRRNHLLEGENGKMEARLVEREREMEELKFMLQRKSFRLVEPAQQQQTGWEPSTSAVSAGTEAGGGVTSGGDSAAPASAGGNATGAAAAAPAAAAAVVAAAAEPLKCPRCGGVCCTPMGVDLVELDFDGQFEQRGRQLKDLVERMGLRDADPHGEGIDPERMKELRALVGLCCQLRHSAMNAEGAKALALFDGGRKWISGLEGNEGRWAGVIKALKLSEEQKEQLLQLRQEHLAKLRSIYQHRQDLNLQAMALMLPRKSPLLQLDTTIEGKLANMSGHGYLAIARANLELGALLDEVKNTIRREQRAVTDINSIAISNILTSIQAAIFITESYPELSDLLAMCNALARQMGREDVAGSGGCGGTCRLQDAAAPRRADSGTASGTGACPPNNNCRTCVK
ncbi:hypothetical protein N2152v2_001132 [Parachlorella kessleri]